MEIITAYEVYLPNFEEGYYQGRNGVKEILRDGQYDEDIRIIFEDGTEKIFDKGVPNAITRKEADQ